MTSPSKESSDSNSDDPYESLVAGIQLVSQHNRKVRNMILDYALGAAVIGLIPIPGLLLLKILAVLILIIKMRRHVRALWGFPTGHDILAFVSNWFGSLGCLAIALMAWLTVLAIGAFVPFVDSLARRLPSQPSPGPKDTSRISSTLEVNGWITLPSSDQSGHRLSLDGDSMMAKFKRRQVLLAGVTTGVAASVITDYWRQQRDRQRQAELETLAEAQRNSDSLLQQAFQQDAATAKEIRQIATTLRLTPPTIPYSHERSKLLIECSKLATQQYLKGKIDPTYDGTLTSLPAYRSNLDRYRLIAAFKGVEEEIEETVDVNVPVTQSSLPDPVHQQAEQTEATIQDTVREAVKLKRKIPVYFGFALSSDTDSLIVFRGTQRTTEWIDDLTALQEDYRADAKPSYGKIHAGFMDVYQQILDPLPATVAKQLNPSRPCFIGGHSLGAALATLASIEIALTVPQLRSQLQLYTYASPRVGDPTFAESHSRLIPNSYRVVNLADVITLVPPTKLNGTYVHLGQEWAFLSQNGDVLPNHVVDTYRNAINRGLESHTAKTYLNLLRDS